MGFTLPSSYRDSTSPMDQAKALISQKATIELEIQSQIAILKANNADMQTPLVDAEGFPRADLDIYAVRNARVRIIELRNDLKAAMDAIAKALEGVFDPALAAPQSNPDAAADSDQASKPFAEVNGVAPGSPAAEADLRRKDLIVKFGSLDQSSFTSNSLQPLADYVSAHENRAITIRVLRDGQAIFLTFTPRQGWGGRGMLGCHIIPYKPETPSSA